MKTKNNKANNNIKKLIKYIFDRIVKKIKVNNALSIFAQERSKFEGWLKVELCNILSEKFEEVRPEIDRFDITFNDTAIELKTINTNYNFRDLGVKDKTRPITSNIKGILKDISKLKNSGYNKKMIIFIIFPLERKNSYWQKHHIIKIRNKIDKDNLFYREFEFKSNVPGVIYICTVK